MTAPKVESKCPVCGFRLVCAGCVELAAARDYWKAGCDAAVADYNEVVAGRGVVTDAMVERAAVAYEAAVNEITMPSDDDDGFLFWRLLVMRAALTAALEVKNG